MYSIIQQVSPGVVINEIEVVERPQAHGSLTKAAFVGEFQWGPVAEVVHITNPGQLYTRFRPPLDNNPFSNMGASFFTAYDYLSYGAGTLFNVRAAGWNANNSYLANAQYLQLTDGVTGRVKTNAATQAANSGDSFIFLANNTFTRNIVSGMSIFKEPMSNKLLYSTSLNTNKYWARTNINISSNSNNTYLPAPFNGSANGAELLVPVLNVNGCNIKRVQNKDKFSLKEGFTFDSSGQVVTAPLDTSTKYITFSSYVKRYGDNVNGSGNANVFSLQVLNKNPKYSIVQNFDFTNPSSPATVKTHVGSGTSMVNTSNGISSIGNGWYRCWVTALLGTDQANNDTQNYNTYELALYSEDNDGKHSGGVVSTNNKFGFYVWGTQVEQTYNATSKPRAFSETTEETYVSTVFGTLQANSNILVSLQDPIPANVEIFNGEQLGFKSVYYNNDLHIPNVQTFETYNFGDLSSYGSFIARYPGVMGDSIKVAVCSDAGSFNNWIDSETGVDYSTFFDDPPGTSEYVLHQNETDNFDFNYGLNDEIYIVISDALGLFTGTAGTLLEKFILSKGSDVLGNNGRNIFYVDYINKHSNYIYVTDYVNPLQTWSNWGQPIRLIDQYDGAPNVIQAFSGGTDGTIDIPDITACWDLLKSKDLHNYGLVMTGSYANSAPVNSNYPANTILSYVFNNIVNYRKDALMLISPDYNLIYNKFGSEANNIAAWVNDNYFGLQINSSYAALDCNWKYRWDQWQKIYRWIPVNGDVAGLCSRTDKHKGPWCSPAGYNRGKLMHVEKLMWNPDKQDRDILYRKGINPVIHQTGEGTLLFGDKTLYKKNSSFNRINVRRLFLELEKKITRMADRQLFEMNNHTTRAKFVGLVEPYLRHVQGKNGIYNFKVVCNAHNNPPSVVNNNGFVADIYVQPEKSINFIQLNMVSVPEGIRFNTIVV